MAQALNLPLWQNVHAFGICIAALCAGVMNLKVCVATFTSPMVFVTVLTENYPRNPIAHNVANARRVLDSTRLEHRLRWQPHGNGQRERLARGSASPLPVRQSRPWTGMT